MQFSFKEIACGRETFRLNVRRMNTLCSFWYRNLLFPERFPSLPFVRNVEIAVMTSAILPAVACPKRKKRFSEPFPVRILSPGRKVFCLHVPQMNVCCSSVYLLKMRKRKIYNMIKRKAVCYLMFRTQCTPHWQAYEDVSLPVCASLQKGGECASG